LGTAAVAEQADFKQRLLLVAVAVAVAVLRRGQAQHQVQRR
jgi:hypothetical protein